MAELFSQYTSGTQFSAGTMAGSALGASGLNPIVDRLNSITQADSIASGTSLVFAGSSISSPIASTTKQGVIEIATEDEVQTGTDTARAVVPDTLQSVMSPVGAIVAWLKSFTGTPQTLPTGWVECDGSLLSDGDSVYDGETLPDLNGGEFLRGDSTSGGTGGSDTMAHTHSFSDSATASGTTGAGGSHDHELENIQRTDAPGGTTGLWAHNSSGPDTDIVADHTHSFSDSFTVSGTTGAASNTENRPKYYNVVWIMRIK